ncbi:MAG TPA: alpha/beta hydrolase [Acidimicrobiales bacterium]|nr:alpha/beta hydrolase [Acidimicrobiales bacterium]
MPSIEVNGGNIAYEILGDGPPIVLTPGGRFSMNVPGLRPLAEALAPRMKVLLWDRPNTGASDVKFTGDTESNMHADDLAELLRRLEMAPAVIAGGSAGSRVSLLTAIRHPDVTDKVVAWWLSGGVFGTMTLAMTYNLPFIAAALVGGMEAVAALPQWEDTFAANPGNRDRVLGMDPDEFVRVMQSWLLAYVPEKGRPIPGVEEAQLAGVKAPCLVFRSGTEDQYHTMETSLAVQRLIPGSTLAEPPWGEDEWPRLQKLTAAGQGFIFDCWPKLAPQVLEFTGA